MIFNEDSRVKIPALVHLTRIGFKYLSLKTIRVDKSTNILVAIFKEKIVSLNPELSGLEVDKLYDDVSLALGFED